MGRRPLDPARRCWTLSPRQRPFRVRQRAPEGAPLRRQGGHGGDRPDTWQWSEHRVDERDALCRRRARPGHRPRAGRRSRSTRPETSPSSSAGRAMPSAKRGNGTGRVDGSVHRLAMRKTHPLPARTQGRRSTRRAGGSSSLEGSAAGDGGESTLGDTWEWDGTAWTAACTSDPCAGSHPPSRSSPSFAYDAATQTSVLFGGSGDDATLFGDTWVWNGTSWTGACASGCVPAPRRSPPKRWRTTRRGSASSSKGRAASRMARRGSGTVRPGRSGRNRTRRSRSCAMGTRWRSTKRAGGWSSSAASSPRRLFTRSGIPGNGTATSGSRSAATARSRPGFPCAA